MPWCGTTTTTITIPTTILTTIPSQGFSGYNFICEKITNGYKCKIDYNNNLGERAVVIFLFVNERGEVSLSSTSVVNQGSGSTYGLLYCNYVKPGKYLVFWKAYRESDITLSKEVAWSKTHEVQTIIC
jgi:hypothetical protein